MTAQREEAARLLRLAPRDQAALNALLGAPAVGVAVAFFHAQQAAEKALKAVVCLRGLEYRRTHDLEELAGQLADAGCQPGVDDTRLRLLTPYSVEYRYDEEAPDFLPVPKLWPSWHRCLPGPTRSAAGLNHEPQAAVLNCAARLGRAQRAQRSGCAG